MKINSVDLQIVLGIKSDIPNSGKPEFVMAGRSNVGKSSFINSFINRKAYARTSSTPGKTRTINYYNVNDEFYLVDLPGYGYAQSGKAEQEKWAKMINRYLLNSGNIVEIIQFVDIRHKATDLDRNMYQFVLQNSGYEPVIILTKADKIKRSQLAKSIKMVRESLGASDACIMLPFSSLNKNGLDEVYRLFDTVFKEFKGE